MVEKCELAINEIYQLLNSEDKEIFLLTLNKGVENEIIGKLSFPYLGN